MDRSDLIRSLNQFREEHAQAQERARVALAEADALSKIIDGIEGLVNGSTASQMQLGDETLDRIAGRVQPPVVPPRGQDAVERIMRESPRIWKVPNLTEEVLRRGWMEAGAKNPRAAVYNAVRRLEEKGRVKKIGSGRYRYKEPGGDRESG